MSNYIVVNMFALAILLLIYSKMRPGTGKYQLEEKLFLLLLFSNALILIIDTALWLADGHAEHLARTVNLAAAAMYNLLNPVPCMLWSFYADYLINHNSKNLRKLLFPLLIPTLITGLLSAASLYGGYLFYIDNQNVYHRGPWFPIMVVVCYSYFVYTFIYIYTQRKNLRDTDYYSLLFFSAPPLAGSIIQIWFYGLSLIWCCMTFSLLVVFIYILSNQLYIDHLTGLFNRRQLDAYLPERLKSPSTNKLIGGIMMDLNSFKAINDIYGHAVGDQALGNMADILKNSLGKNDFICRYGGDEFTAIREVDNELDLVNSVIKIRENVEQFNLQHLAPFKLHLSIGFDVYNPNSGMTSQQFLQHIDQLMYEDKKQVKIYTPVHRSSLTS